jgi:hypothetical protein
MKRFAAGTLLVQREQKFARDRDGRFLAIRRSTALRSAQAAAEG